MKDPVVTSISFWGLQISEWVIGLWSTIILLCLWTWHALPVKWTSSGSTARGKKTKKQVTDTALNLMSMWSMTCGRHGPNSPGAWHGCGQPRRWLLDTFQSASLCYPSLSNFVRPVSLAVSSLSLWWQLTPVGPVNRCLLSVFLYLSLSMCLSLSCCHGELPWGRTLPWPSGEGFFGGVGGAQPFRLPWWCSVANEPKHVPLSIITQDHRNVLPTSFVSKNDCDSGKTSPLTGCLTVIIPCE